jgi:hypothetical protein
MEMLTSSRTRGDRAILVTDSNSKAILECPVCNLVVRDSEDVKSIEDNDGCTECVINFMHSTEFDWNNGVKPSVFQARSKILNIFKRGGSYEKK